MEGFQSITSLKYQPFENANSQTLAKVAQYRRLSRRIAIPGLAFFLMGIGAMLGMVLRDSINQPAQDFNWLSGFCVLGFLGAFICTLIYLGGKFLSWIFSVAQARMPAGLGERKLIDEMSLEIRSVASTSRTIILDLDVEIICNTTPPINTFICVVLSIAIYEHADEIQFVLEDSRSQTGLKIFIATGERRQNLVPAPGNLFNPITLILWNYAAGSCNASGATTGQIKTASAPSRWRLTSANLNREIVLTKI